MNRRAFLAAGGIALGAGCSGLMGDSEDRSKPPAECTIDPNSTPGTSGWPSDAGDARNTRSVPTADVPAPPLKLDWTYSMSGRGGVACPLVVGNIVYATSFDESIHALDATTGEKRWQLFTSIDSTPAVVGNRVFLPQYGSVTALDAKTGDELWRTDSLVEDWSFHPRVQATEQTVLVSGEVVLFALDATTGKRRWTFTTGLRTESRPAITDGVAYVGSNDTYVYALDTATGERLWRFKTDGQVSSDITVADGIVYAGAEDGHLFALDAGTGEKRWKRPGGNVETIAADGGHVYVGLEGRDDGTTLRALTADSGTACWSSEMYAPGYAGGMAAGSKHLFLPVGALSARHSQTLGAIDPGTGNVAWRFMNPDARLTSGTAVSDDAVYIGGNNNDGLMVARFVPKR